MKANIGKTYAQIINGRVHWKFTKAELPEWNDSDVQAVELADPADAEVGMAFDGVAFSPYVPTPEEIAAANLAAADLAARQAAKADALITFLIEKTPAEVAARINSDVTDLASARQVMAKLAVAISVLAKQGLR